MLRAGRIIGLARATVCERMARAPHAAQLLCALHRLWQNARDKRRGATVGKHETFVSCNDAMTTSRLIIN